MGVNEILTTITVLIALAAFLSESSRKFVFMKFSKITWLVLLFLFIFCHFLLAFDWLCSRITFLNLFIIPGFPSANIWAYVITLILLTIIVYKFFFGFYPKSKSDGVFQEYMNLILKGEFSQQVSLIEKYHYQDILEYLKIVQKIQVSEVSTEVANNDATEKDSNIMSRTDQSILDWQEKRQKYMKEYGMRIKTTRLKLADIVYHNIVLNDTFVNFVVDNNPYFFAPIIQELNVKELSQQKLLYDFLQILTKNRNYYFFSEIKSTGIVTDNYTYEIPQSAKILTALFSNIKVAELNEPWRGIADEVRFEMSEEAKKEQSPLRERNSERHSDTLWSYRIKIAIHYFDIMVREAINSGSKCSMWMFYYKHFTDLILGNLNVLINHESDANRRSRNFELLEQIFENLSDWKTVVIKSGNPMLLKQIYTTTGACMSSIATSHRLRLEDKLELLDFILDDLLQVSMYEDSNDKSTQKLIHSVIEEGFSSFLYPFNSKSINNDSEEGREHADIIRCVYDRVDRIGLLGVPKAKERLDLFAEQVINKLPR